jgi:hypothetical protein
MKLNTYSIASKSLPSSSFGNVHSKQYHFSMQRSYHSETQKYQIAAKESLGYYELQKHEQWFDEGRSKLLDQKKRARFQWLQDPNQMSGNNLNNIRSEVSRHFRNSKREYLKDKINELATNSKNKTIKDLYRGTHKFKRGYQPRSNLVKDENVNCLQILTIF